MPTERNWDVLLIGGSSGCGKTTLAYQLGRFYQVNVIKVDDLTQAIQSLTTAETLPMLHYWANKDWREASAAKNVEWLMNVSDEIAPAIKSVVQDVHLADSEPCIIEGDFIHPKLCATLASTSNARAKAIFVRESSTQQLLQNFQAREGTQQPYRAEISCAHGNLLATLCEEHAIPLIEARPWITLMQRAIAAIT